MIVFIKSWKNANEQQYMGNKTNKNDETELEGALNSLNLDYFIHYSSFCDEDEHSWRPMTQNHHLFRYMPVSNDGAPNHTPRGML